MGLQIALSSALKLLLALNFGGIPGIRGQCNDGAGEITINIKP